MLSIDKMESYSDAYSTAYMPMGAMKPDDGTSRSLDFMKTLEKSSMSEDKVDIGQNDKAAKETDNYKDRLDERETSKPDRKTEPEHTHKSDEAEHADKKTDKDKKGEKNTDTDNRKDDNQKENSDAVQKQTTTDNPKAVKKNEPEGNARSQSIKELLQKHQVKAQEIVDIKEGAQENQTDAKSKAADEGTKNATVKNLVVEDNDAGIKAGETKEVSAEEMAAHKKLSAESDFEKKLDAALLKNGDKPHKESNIKEIPNVNPSGQDNNGIQQINEIKIKKVLNHNNLLEQYQGMKDKINEGVENSIRMLLHRGENKVNIQLQPPELGKVEVELFLKDNQISAKINTENIAVKEVIMSNMEQLKSNLQNMGHQIDKLEVEVGGFKNQTDHHFGNESSGDGKRKGSSDGGGSVSGEAEILPPNKIRNHQAVTLYLGRSINVII